MPVADSDVNPSGETDLGDNAHVGPSGYRELPFPALSREHVLHCSVHYWYPKYRALSPKSRLIPLPDPFVDYLKADGIVLPPDGNGDEDEEVEFESDISSVSRPRQLGNDEEASSSDEDEDEDADPSLKWPETHATIKSTITELGGKVVPKLNWSAPKDATWINPSNSMECRSANDIYLMLKSSDFVTHDLELWDDGCESDADDNKNGADERTESRARPPYSLFLRKAVQINPSVEFRVFVRNRVVIGITQRDVNHFDFLFPMIPQLRQLIRDFFEDKLRATFPDDDFVFDVYIPAPHQRVWLIDINPWAARTDPLLFSWLELLTMRAPRWSASEAGDAEEDDQDDIGTKEAFETLERRHDGGSDEELEHHLREEREGIDFVRIPFRPRHDDVVLDASITGPSIIEVHDDDVYDEVDDGDDGRFVPEFFIPEFRLIKRDDPEAYSFNTPQYSAHKLPKDVVEASQSGVGPLREFAEQWKEMLAQEEQGRRNGAGASAR